MTKDVYSNEYVTFDALKNYGVEFDELMRLSDEGRIARDSHINSRGSEVYTFRRGDVIEYCSYRRSHG